MPFLSSVVVPTREVEVDLILRNLELWSMPGFEPGCDNDSDRPRLVIIFNNDDAAPRQTEIEAAFSKGRLNRFFSGIHIHFLSLRGLDDLYSKKRSGPVGPGGYAAGPNNQFFQSMDFCRTSDSAILYLETDCNPIRSGWLTELQDVAWRNGDALVLGSIYRGSMLMAPRELRHLNGNAMYFVGQPRFAEFLTDLQRWLAHLLQNHSKSVAYDLVFETVVHLAPKNLEAQAFHQRYSHRVRSSLFIQNICKPHEIYAQPRDLVRQLLDNSPETYILHGPLFSDAADDLMQGGWPVLPENLELRKPTSREAGIKANLRLQVAKYWLILQIRNLADWLETRNVKLIFVPKFLRR